MKITNVSSYVVPLRGQEHLLVRVDTDEDVYGWGESGLSRRERSVGGAVRHYSRLLIGRDPMARAALWQEMYRSQYFEGGRVLSAAIAAIDIALHDIVGKKLNVPVYELLGGLQREYVPTLAAAVGSSAHEVTARANALVEQGRDAIRVAVVESTRLGEAEPSLADLAGALEAVRDAATHDCMLCLEYHRDLGVAEAASFCQMLPPHTLDFLEDPLSVETPSAYEALRQLTDVPFAVGAALSSKWAFAPYIERDIANLARVDVCSAGGFTEASKIAGWCEARYVDVVAPNVATPISTAAHAHFATALANFAWLETRPVDDTAEPSEEAWLFPLRPLVGAERVQLADAPGLGVDVDLPALAEILERASFDRSAASNKLA